MAKKYFDDVTLQWCGVDYKVKADEMMGAIHRIEEYVTMKELGEYMQDQRGVQVEKLANAFASVLRYAGADVSNEEVYVGMFDMREPGRVSAAVILLLNMMMPPQRNYADGGTPIGNSGKDASQSSPSATQEDESSRKPSKQQSESGS